MRFRKTIVILNVLSLLPVCVRCELCNVGPANCHQLPLFCLMGYYFSGTVSQINPFFCKVVLVMGFYHINGKATRMSHLEDANSGGDVWCQSDGSAGRYKLVASAWTELWEQEGKSRYEHAEPHYAIRRSSQCDPYGRAVFHSKSSHF